MLRDWLENIASNNQLRGEDYRVLLVLLAKADSESVLIAQSEIAEILSIERSRVSRAIKRLTSIGVIDKRYIAGKLVGYSFLLDHD